MTLIEVLYKLNQAYVNTDTEGLRRRDWLHWRTWDNIQSNYK